MSNTQSNEMALDIRGLRKSYDDGNEALKGVDLQVESGDFFALLGPNGAGKSTLIGIVASLVRKSNGSVSVYGHSIDSEPDAVRAHIGLVPQEFNFNVFESVINVVVNSAGIMASHALKHSNVPSIILIYWICGVSAKICRAHCLVV